MDWIFEGEISKLVSWLAGLAVVAVFVGALL